MTRIGTGMREFFATIGAAKWFFARMYANVLFQVMFEFERFVTVGAFEFAQQSRFVVADHVPLQAIHVGETFLAYFAAL